MPGSSTGLYIPVVELHAVTCTVWCGSGCVDVWLRAIRPASPHVLVVGISCGILLAMLFLVYG